MTTRPDIHAKAETLIEALPYFQRYAGRSFVVKYGGNAMGDERAAREFAEDVVLLRAVGINPVVVHGGGPQIGAMLDSNIEKARDLGFVGEPSKVDTAIIETATGAGMIPVVAPIGVGEDGHTYNINADTMAGALAAALGAARLLLLTDVPGVLDKQGELLTDLTPADIHRLRDDGTISGGMIPKLETCVQAVESGCEAAVVLDGRVPHAMLLEFFTARGAGTLVSRGA